MSWLLRIVLFFASQFVQGEVVSRVKRRGVKTYLLALQRTRLTLICAVALFFIFHTILLAGFGALITGMMLLDLERKTILMILFGIFMTLFLIPALLLAAALSERLWYKVSGAKKMVENILDPS